MTRVTAQPCHAAKLHLPLTMSKESRSANWSNERDLRCHSCRRAVKWVEAPAGAFGFRVQKAFFLCSNQERERARHDQHKSYLNGRVCAVGEHRRSSLNVTSFPSRRGPTRQNDRFAFSQASYRGYREGARKRAEWRRILSARGRRPKGAYDRLRLCFRAPIVGADARAALSSLLSRSRDSSRRLVGEGGPRCPAVEQIDGADGGPAGRPV